MKPAYTSIQLSTGAQNSGLCEVKILPIEWLASDPVVDFNSGKVLAALSLLSGKDFITLFFTPDSYLFDEKPKSNRAGTFYEVSVKGTVNLVNSATQQVMETLRYHQFIALVKTRDKRVKLVGNREAGLIKTTFVSRGNSSGGIEIATIELAMECEELTPFYEV